MISIKGLKPSELIHKHLIWKINTAGLLDTLFTPNYCVFLSLAHITAFILPLKIYSKSSRPKSWEKWFYHHLFVDATWFHIVFHLDIFKCDSLEPLYILEYVWGVEKMCFCLSGWNVEEMTHWWSVLTQCGQWKQIHLSSTKVLSRGRPEIAIWHHALKQPPLISYLNPAREKITAEGLLQESADCWQDLWPEESTCEEDEEDTSQHKRGSVLMWRKTFAVGSCSSGYDAFIEECEVTINWKCGAVWKTTALLWLIKVNGPVLLNV